MPWTVRPARQSSARLRHGFRRWRYDHSQQLVALGIGAGVVVLTLLVLAALKVLG